MTQLCTCIDGRGLLLLLLLQLVLLLKVQQRDIPSHFKTFHSLLIPLSLLVL
jgi:hypothetical protein